MKLTITSGKTPDINVSVNSTDVLVGTPSNVLVEVTPTPKQVINIDRGIIGPTGATGATGPQGPQGPSGEGSPIGGTTGQVIAKKSNVNYDTQWITLATVANTGSYTDLINKPTIPNAQVNSDWNAVSGIAQILNKPTLATVATSGSYNDLSSKPSLGTIASQNSNSISITGGSISGTTITTPNQSSYETWTTTSAPTYSEGRIWFDSTNHTLAQYNDVTNNIVHLGEEVQLKVINNTGSTIPNGSPVYITGTSSGQTYPNIALAKADTITTSNVIGLTNGAIANGAAGYVTTIGLLNPANTGSFSVGDVLYLSPYSAGQIMNTIPPTGYPVRLGIVAYANTPNGAIYITKTNVYALASNIVGTVAIANGGTGQTTANAAFNALAPSQTSNSGKYLTSDGTNTAWAFPSLSTKTSAYTLTSTDSTILGNATSAAFTLTLPTAVGTTGKTYVIKKTDSSTNAVTIGTTSSQTIDGNTTYAISNQWGGVTLQSDGSNWLIIGNIFGRNGTTGTF